MSTQERRLTGPNGMVMNGMVMNGMVMNGMVMNACSSQQRCVVPLVGLAGVGINADGTSWGESGLCDETCQRWVSACLLARTNAYGVHVQISMRAPANAPTEIKNALRLADGEATTCPMGSENDPACGYTLREGAFYGNLFQTTPGAFDANNQFVPMSPPQPDGTVPGVVMSTPVFTACAGEGSNIPQITNRFCASQGDRVVIDVPGTCAPTETLPGVCAGEDPTTGAFQTCSTSAGSHYDEVITVFLKQPIATCGNAVCEQGEDASCASDCHPGTWAMDFPQDYGFGSGVVDQDATSEGFAQPGMSAIAHDDPVYPNSIVVVGQSQHDFNLGDGFLEVAQGGEGVLAKYSSDGNTLLWSRRFAPVAPPSAGFPWHLTGGVKVVKTGRTHSNSQSYITVLGEMVTDVRRGADGVLLPPVPVSAVWLDTFTLDGHLVEAKSYVLPIGNPPSGSVPKHFPDLFTTRAWTVDVDGYLDLVAGYCGTFTFDGSAAGPFDLKSNVSCRPPATAAFYPAVFVAKSGPQPTPPPAGEPQYGRTVWARSFGGGDVLSGGTDVNGDRGLSLVANLTDIVVLTRGAGGKLVKLSSADGSTAWQHAAPDHASYTVAAFGPNGGVLLGGTLEPGAESAPEFVACNDGAFAAIRGLPPFLEVLADNGGCAAVTPAYVSCPPTPPGGWPNGSPCEGSLAVPGSYRVDPSAIVFDHDGNAILASFGNPAPGGGITFPLAHPPWITFPSYHSNSIYLWGFSGLSPRWAKHVPIILSSSVLGMDIDGFGQVVVSGNYSGSMLFDDRLLVTAVPRDPRVIDAFLGSFKVPSISDATNPLIGATSLQPSESIDTVPKTITVQATGPAGADVFFNPPTAIDEGNAGVSVVCSPRPNTTFPIGTTSVTCTASDPLGNSSSASFHVTVADLAGPVLSRVADIAVQATSASGAIVNYAAPTAIDQVDGTRPVTCTGPASGSLFAVGRTTITCAATDLSNHQSHVTFSVVVRSPADTTPPSITVPAPMTVEATSAAGVKVTYSASATDNVGVVSFACAPVSGSVFAIKKTTVNCSASDAAGNQASKSFTITVVDTTAPAWSSVPGTIVAYATSTAGAKVTYTKPCATDAVDGTRPVTCTPASGAQFPVGKTTVNCTTSDTAGNTGRASFTVWVKLLAPTNGSFYLQPINSDGSSIFKLGSTIPVKFKLTGASAGITNLVATLSLAKVSSQVTGTAVEAVSTAAANSGNTYRYDAAGQQYIFNLSTKGMTAGTWSLQTNLGDLVPHTVNVSLK